MMQCINFLNACSSKQCIKLFDVSYDGNLFDVGLGDSLNYISVL